MQILPDIYLLDGFAYANHPNFYLVVGPEGNVIVDAGTLPEELERADARTETWGISLDQVGGLLLTHSHYDHIGNAAAIRERGAAVFAGPSDAEGIELSDNRTVPYAAGFDLPPCKVDHVVSDGERIDICGLRFDVIHAPGHTDGCIIYQLEHRGKIVWFVGDVVMSKDTAFTPELGWQGGEDCDKPAYIASLKKLAAMEVDCILAGHYLPYLEQGKRLVGRAYVKALCEWR